jgi:predicted GIY-YIG superfamily endonuclease
MKWKIYVILNTVNEKKYVGITKNGIKNRFRGHSIAKTMLGEDLRKYGKDKFISQIIDETDNRKEAGKKEKNWINVLKTKQSQGGYNADVIFTNNPTKSKQKQKNSLLEELESNLFLYNMRLF